MATIEERLALIEHEHAALKNDNAELKKAIELQTIAIGALVNKATLEKLNEKNGKIFDALMAHDRLTNVQLTELRDQQIEENGKIVGLQTEIRQRFDQQDGKTVGLQTDMRQRFEQQDAAMNARFEQQDATMNARFDQITLLLTAWDSRG
jgi:hypothetical protein